MNELYYINISFNKLRSCEKTNIGILPSLRIFLCDNNYLKYINCFEKYCSVEILSFNNNRITDLGCLEKLSNLKKLTHLSIINNPITKIVNYRKILIYIFQNVKVLDNREVNQDERIINIKKEIHSNYENYNKIDDSFGTPNNNCYNKNINNNNSNLNQNNNISKSINSINNINVNNLFNKNINNNTNFKTNSNFNQNLDNNSNNNIFNSNNNYSTNNNFNANNNNFNICNNNINTNNNFFNIYNNNVNNIIIDNNNNIININKKINSNISLIKNKKQRVNYVQIGYNLYPFKNNKLFSSSQKRHEIKKKTKNHSYIQMNINENENLLQQRINNNDFNWHFILSKKNERNKYCFPKISKSINISKHKTDISKLKHCLNSKNNKNGSVILSNEKRNKMFSKPQSTARVPSSKNRGNPSIYHNQDYFAKVINSVNNDNCSNQLITLKNWSVRKINFDIKKIKK